MYSIFSISFFSISLSPNYLIILECKTKPVTEISRKHTKSKQVPSRPLYEVWSWQNVPKIAWTGRETAREWHIKRTAGETLCKSKRDPSHSIFFCLRMLPMHSYYLNYTPTPPRSEHLFHGVPWQWDPLAVLSDQRANRALRWVGLAISLPPPAPLSRDLSRHKRSDLPLLSIAKVNLLHFLDIQLSRYGYSFSF